MSDTMIKERSTIHGNIDPKFLYPEIKVAQDMYIHPILGSALFNKLLVDVNASGLVAPYKTLVDDYIVDSLMYYAISQLPMGMGFQFWNKGVIRKVGDSTELPSMSELVDIANHYRLRGEWYAQRLMLYLKEYATESFIPEYVQPGDGIDTINPANSAFTMPIYLDGYHTCQSLDKNNCNCNGEKY